MTWSGRELELPKTTYHISRALTTGAPEAGDLYRALSPAGFAYLGLPPVTGTALDPRQAVQIQALSRRWFLPIQRIEWHDGRPVFVFAARRPLPLDQLLHEAGWPAGKVAREIARLAEAVAHFHEATGSAVCLLPGRVLALSGGRRLALVPPMTLNRSPVACQEDVRQLALVAARLLTGAPQTVASLETAEALLPQVRGVLQRACRGEYAGAQEFARDLTVALRSGGQLLPVRWPRRRIWIGVALLALAAIVLGGVLLGDRLAPPRFPQVVTEPARLDSLKLAVAQYRLVEREALRSLNQTALDQLPVYAYGEALATLNERVGQLQNQGLFAELTVDRLDVERVVLLDQQTAAAQTLEKWSLRTYRASAPTDALQSELVYEGRMIYGMVYRDGRWKVERLRPLGQGK